jgi:hypothetical protein
MSKIDEQLLLDFANHFLGYGALNSPLWLIGPEAGGGATIDEVYQRALAWDDRGRKEIEDLQGYHAALGLPAKSDWTKKIQPTWGSLIRVVLALKLNGKIVDTEDVLEFQKSDLGNSGGQNSVLDLSQFSSPSMSDWNLGGCGISWLETRRDYETRILRPRHDLFRKKLALYKPKLVLFYGLGHQRWWERIAGSESQPIQFAPSNLPQLSWVRNEIGLVAMMPHPNGVRLPGKGAHKKFFADVGAALREMRDATL